MPAQLKKSSRPTKAVEVAKAATSPILQTVSGESASAPVQPARYEPALALDLIEASPVNPRKTFAGAAFDELVGSIRALGVQQPIKVRPLPGFAGRFEVVAGERRLRASREAGRETIPAVVQDLDDIAAGEIQAIENLARADLTPLEEAGGYKHLLALPGYTMERLIKTTGKAESTIYGKLKLLELPEPAKAAVQEGTLTTSVAELIARASANVRGELTKRLLEGTRDWNGHKRQVTFQEAKRAVDNVEEDAKRARAYEAASVKARAGGLTVLPVEESSRIVPHSYGDQTQLQHNCGYVAAAAKCPDDPKGRTYGEILEDNLLSGDRRFGLERFAAINREGKVFEVFQREAAVKALKKLGIWRAEGSKALKEKEKFAAEKRRAAEKKAQNEAAVATLVAAIERSGPGRLPVSFWKQLAAELPHVVNFHNHGARAVVARRGLSHPRKGDERLVAELAAENDGGVAVALVAEMVVGSFEHYGFRDRLDRLNQALGILPTDVAGPAPDAGADVCGAVGEVGPGMFGSGPDGTGNEGAGAGLKVIGF